MTNLTDAQNRLRSVTEIKRIYFDDNANFHDLPIFETELGEKYVPYIYYNRLKYVPKREYDRLKSEWEAKLKTKRGFWQRLFSL